MQALKKQKIVSGKQRLRLLQPVTRNDTAPVTTLWMSLYIPRLPLHAVTHNEAPSAVIETHAGRSLIIACNKTSEDLAITNGMTVSAALSLYGALNIYKRNPESEYVLLNKVADIAYRYTDKISFYATNNLVLEIHGSLKLFGSPAALQQALEKDLQQLDLQAVLSVAPTARAASWLSLCDQTEHIHDFFTLKKSLRVLPASLIADKEKIARQFQNCGIRTLGDYMKLPRKDANRRFGVHALRYLQQALGKQAELLQYYRPSRPFSAEWNFDEPVTTCAQVENAVKRLLRDLRHYLKARCAAIQYFMLYLTHTDQSTSTLRIGSSHYQRDDVHLKKLLYEHLHNYVIKQAINSIRLCADKLHVLPAGNMDLFSSDNNSQEDWKQLLDILKIRLGPHTIQPLSACDDPRPEYAYQLSHAQKLTRSHHFNWPLWLMEKPIELDAAYLPKNMTPEKGAERIEQGWWADNDIRRDYYCIENDKGVRNWIFQDCRTKQWFLHGLFG